MEKIIRCMKSRPGVFMIGLGFGLSLAAIGVCLGAVLCAWIGL